MTQDAKLAALLRDVADIQDRIAMQCREAPDHEVALAMYQADLRRAQFRLMEYQTANPSQRVRRYEDGRRVA